MTSAELAASNNIRQALMLGTKWVTDANHLYKSTTSLYDGARALALSTGPTEFGYLSSALGGPDALQLHLEEWKKEAGNGERNAQASSMYLGGGITGTNDGTCPVNPGVNWEGEQAAVALRTGDQQP